MKRVICFFVCLLLVVPILACNKADNKPTNLRSTVFEAVVLEVSSDHILVMPVADAKEFAAAMDIGLVVYKTENFPDLHVGDKVRIDYDGSMTRSIPAHLGEVYSIVLCD